MLKVIIFILLIYVHIDYITTDKTNRRVRNANDVLKNESPTYSPKKKTKVIFYMGGQDHEDEENDNNANRNVNKGKQGMGANKGATGGTGNDEGNAPNGHDEGTNSNKNNGYNTGQLQANSPLHYDNSNNKNESNNGQNKIKYDKMKEEYENLKKKEEEEAERINRERMADMNRDKKGKNKKLRYNREKEDPYDTDYEYIDNVPHSTNSNAKNKTNSGVYDELGNGPYNLIGKESYVGPNGKTYTPYVGPDGKFHGAYIGPDGDIYEPYVDPDGKFNGTYIGPDGKTYEPFVGPDGKTHESFVGPDGNTYKPYIEPDGKFHGSYIGPDGKTYEPYVEPDGKFHGTYIGPDGKTYKPFAGHDGRTHKTFVGPDGNTYESFVGPDGNTYTPHIEPDGKFHGTYIGPDGKTYTPHIEPDGQFHGIYIGPDGKTYKPFVGSDSKTQESFVGPDGNTYIPHIEPDGKFHGTYIGPDGKTYTPHIEPDGQFHGNYIGPDGKTYKPFVGSDGKTHESFVGPDGNTYTPRIEQDGKFHGNYIGPDGKTYTPHVEPDGKFHGTYIGPDGKTYKPFVGSDSKTQESFVGPDGNTYTPHIEPDGKFHGTYIGPDGKTYTPHIEPDGQFHGNYIGPDGKTYKPFVGPDGKTHESFVGPDGNTYKPYIEPDGKFHGSYIGPDGKTYTPHIEQDGKFHGNYIGPDGKTYKPFVEPDEKIYKPYFGPKGKTYESFVGPDGNTYTPHIEADGKFHGNYIGPDGKIYTPQIELDGKFHGNYIGPDGKTYQPFVGPDGQIHESFVGPDGNTYETYIEPDGKFHGSYIGPDGKTFTPQIEPDGKFHGNYIGPDGNAYKLFVGPDGKSYVPYNGSEGKGEHDGPHYGGGPQGNKDDGTTYSLNHGAQGNGKNGGAYPGKKGPLSDYLHDLRPVNEGEGTYGKGYNPLVYTVQQGDGQNVKPHDKRPNEISSDNGKNVYDNTPNKKKVYKKPSQRRRSNPFPQNSDDNSSDTEYELNEGDYNRSKPGNKTYISSDHDENGHPNETDNYRDPRLTGMGIGDNGIPGRGNTDNMYGGNPIHILHDNSHAKKRANEIEDNLNKGEYSRDKVGNKNKGSGGNNKNDTDDLDDPSILYYLDNGQDMSIKEKLLNSNGEDYQTEDGLNDNDYANRKPVNYHFSNYMNFDKKEILGSNEIELEKMIGTKFSKEVENYCRQDNSVQKEGDYLNTAFEYARALEELRGEMLVELNRQKYLGLNNFNNILQSINNSLNRKNLNGNRDVYEDKSFINEANAFRNENINPLSAKYNKIMKQYLCHVFVKNPGTNQLERLYFHNLALGELIQPIRTKYSKLASSSIGLNYEIYIVSSSNVYMLGHMLLLSLAYLSFNNFFVKGLKSFYSLQTMIMANSDYSFFMFNEMCNIYYNPSKKFEKDITFIPLESRPGRTTTSMGERKTICDLLELVLNVFSLINIHEIDNVFNKNNVNGYENSLSFSFNAIRIFSQVCPRDDTENALKCNFEKSKLYNSRILKKDIGQKENQKSLKRAFDLLRIFAEIENTSSTNEPNPHYIKLIFNQNEYVDFYKFFFWYETRELVYVPGTSANKKKKRKKNYIFDQFMMRGQQLKKKLLKMDAKYNIKSKALPAFYALVDRYNTISSKSQKARKLFLNDVSSARHYFYLNSILSKSPKSNLESIKKALIELQTLTNSPLKFMARGNNIEYLNQIAKNENLFYVNLFIISAFARKDPVRSYYSDKRKMLSATLSEKFATSTSAFIPHKLRKLVVGMKKGFLKRKLLTKLAMMKLLQHIPSHILENIITTIRFTTHSIASMQIIQNARFVPRSVSANDKLNSQFAKDIFTEGGFVGYADNLMSAWFSKGFEEYKKEKIENQKMETSIQNYLKDYSNEYDNSNEEMTDKEKLIKELNEENEKVQAQKQENKLILNQNDKWDHYINKEYARALRLWLELNDAPHQKNSVVYKVVEDSKYLLENNIEENIIFSRTVKATKQTVFRKFFNKIVSLGNMLLRKPSFKVEHALWFGATIDIKKAFVILEKVSELHKLIRDQDESWLINEAFIEIVDHVIQVSTEKHLREPFSVVRNPGMMAINPNYNYIPHEDRLKELQNSMCADHCSAVWKMISSFALQHLKNPDSLQTYEVKFSSNSLGNKIDDKDFVNNFKMIIGGDAVLHYFDNLLPKSMKKELKAMKYGASLTSAFSLKLTKVIFSEMQLPYLSKMFYMQAPYFGNFIGKWQKEREKSRMKELLGFMTLGTLSAYTILSAMDITQHATDIGVGPATSCYTSTIPPPKQVCIQQVVKATLTNSTEACMKSVFSVGLFASIGPYLFAPMAGLALWNVLKSEFKVLQRIDMALKGVFKSMWKKFLSLSAIRRLKGIFKRRKAMKKKLIENAEHKMMEMKNNPNKVKDHKMAIKKIHNQSKGGYNYISYARIKI
ncbi:rhoptry neck protein 2, putative [Plasmodium malariae]|uniref:Rhoptry neck protein 2, putative n=1 Tax=Plasmodium malariae TaxID=5858 RepID=A0A1D3SQ69_PLAMA|nr:rhoptry neck protein 2, putative [Plasmodium malariae]SCO94053.1 rhoptry neck protein 2, putative [Plasmodium malariae]